MARDRASIRLDIWADQDWRDLPQGAQHLYMLLLSHPTLSYAGVADWKPGRLAAMTHGATAESVIADAGALREGIFIVVDADSEEVLVRSFIKHDGLMKQPKLVVSMANAYAAIASRTIREVVAFEVQKLRTKEPELNAWGVKQVQTVLAAKGCDMHTVTPPVTPNDDQGQGLPTSTSTTTATATPPEGKMPSLRLPSDWVPTAEHYERAKTLRVDIVQEIENFKGHAETHDRHAANWNSAFTTWLKKAKPSTKSNTDWALRR